MKLFKRLFYKVEYIRDDREVYETESEAGFYLTPRTWMWIVFCPVILVLRLILSIPGHVADILTDSITYRKHWISSEPRKLTRKQYNQYFDHLSKNL